ncbi:hypothetical protein [Paraliomyxa miuraensis]|uniref:hypothetical protein n=1 Tax=Paraliomyxa miuraensis TaxID=376150 RepID=UPI002253A97D|nr:hypothetical protein [Paraliomyxa miuraensis]MCX4240379.1 hypothetical protein [Paraliomyxa miuraensis]
MARPRNNRGPARLGPPPAPPSIRNGGSVATSDDGPSWMDYVKKAFTWRWNLLVFGGGVVAALLSGAPDVALPLVAAAELVYLGGLTAAPRFRAAVDAELHAAKAPAENAAKAQKSLGQMLSGLAPARAKRFQALLTRCLEMKRIAAGVRGHSGAAGRESVPTPALDRMLWAFVRLLWSQQALGRFLESTDEAGMQAKIGELEAKIEEAKARDDEKIMRALVDSLATAQLRLDNFQKAARNAEFVEIELDRIEGKIQALVEMAVSHEDPDFISTQVDSVAESITHTEQAIREMTFITGLGSEVDETAPSILGGVEQLTH